MAITKERKRDIVAKLEDSIEKSKSIVFTNMKGLSVKDSEAIRAKCDEESVVYMMAKKTLLKRALESKGITEVDPREMEGEIATAFSLNDEVAPAKIMADFAKEKEGFTAIAGLLMSQEPGSRLLDSEKLAQLAKLPSKDELRAKVVGSLAAPMTGMLNVLQGNTRALVQVLKAISQK